MVLKENSNLPISQIEDTLDRIESYRVLIIGLPRNGKTLLAVILGYLLHEFNGFKVYPNFPILYTKEYDALELIKFKYDIQNDLVILDEQYGLTNARMSGTNRVNELFSYFFFQSGKSGLSVFGIAQLGRTIDVLYREIADYVINCERIGDIFAYTVYSGSIKTNEFAIPYNSARQFFGMYKSYDKIIPISLDKSRIDFNKLKLWFNKYPTKKSFCNKAHNEYKFLIGDKISGYYDSMKAGLEKEAIEDLKQI